MRHIALAVVFALWPLTSQAACTGADFADRLTPDEQVEIAAAVAQMPNPEGLIWQATRGDQQITVIGTMHIYDPRLDAIFAYVAQTVTSADIVLVEATPDDEAALTAAMAADPSMIFITEGPTLAEQLEPELWAALAEASRARSIPPVLIAKMKPWYLTLTLSIPPCAMQDIFNGQAGLDHMIIDAAQKANVPLKSLEPWTTLLTLMQAGTDAEQLEALKLSLMAPELQSEMFVSMFESYFAGRIGQLWEMSRISMRYVPGFDSGEDEATFAKMEQMLLIDRNTAWIPVIDAAVTGHQNAVVAVGAAHLPGESGILNLLEQDGWTISRLD